MRVAIQTRQLGHRGSSAPRRRTDACRSAGGRPRGEAATPTAECPGVPLNADSRDPEGAPLGDPWTASPPVREAFPAEVYDELEGLKRICPTRAINLSSYRSGERWTSGEDAKWQPPTSKRLEFLLSIFMPLRCERVRELSKADFVDIVFCTSVCDDRMSRAGVDAKLLQPAPTGTAKLNLATLETMCCPAFAARFSLKSPATLASKNRLVRGTTPSTLPPNPALPVGTLYFSQQLFENSGGNFLCP